MIKATGKILFDPINRTKKHLSQSSWKKVAMLVIDGDICEYYAWFIKKRYNLTLNKPLRGPHITFINDKFNGSNERWSKIADQYNEIEIEVLLNPSPRTDDKHWWLIVDEKSREFLHTIRKEIGLSERPFFGLHLSLGYANERNIDHSIYIHRMIKNKLIR